MVASRFHDSGRRCSEGLHKILGHSAEILARRGGEMTHRSSLIVVSCLAFAQIALAQDTSIKSPLIVVPIEHRLPVHDIGITRNAQVSVPASENEHYENRFEGASLSQRISAAVADCGTSECLVIVPANESGSVNTGYPVAIPDNIVIWDLRNGGMGTFIANAGNCKSTAGFLNIQLGASIPAGQVGGVSSQCVGAYIVVKPDFNMDGWGFNSVTTCQSERDCWGSEVDVAPVAGTSQAVGFDSVAAGSGQASNMPAFRCLTTINTNPVGGWKNCLEIQGVTDTAFLFLAKDEALKLIQNVSGSESPQTVATNGNCTTLPYSQLYVGEFVSVDAGGSQEDVQILNTGCQQNTSVTAVFRKNHRNPTPFSEYGAQRLWDAQNYVASAQSPYLWGSIQKYNLSNTPNVLGFGVIDSTGISRLAEFYTPNNVHTWREVGTTGFSWQNLSGAQVASLSDNGTYQPSAYGTQTNCAVNSASPARCSSAASGAIVVPGRTTTYTVMTTAVTASSRVFLSPTTDPSNLPLNPNCVAPASGPVVQSSRVAGTSFTFSLPRTSGATCFNYWIVN